MTSPRIATLFRESLNIHRRQPYQPPDQPTTDFIAYQIKVKKKDIKTRRRIAAEWLARRTVKSHVPGSIPGLEKAHLWADARFPQEEEGVVSFSLYNLNLTSAIVGHGSSGSRATFLTLYMN